MTKQTIASFVLREETGHTRNGDPMVTGVPIEKGLVQDPESLVLYDERDRALRSAAEATARWADGSIKWALLTVPQINVKGKSQQRLALGTRPASQGQDKGGKPGVRVRQADGGLRVDTGRLRFTVQEQGPLVKTFESQVDGRWQKRASNLDDTVCIAHHGERKTYRASAASRTIEVESESPLRVVIAVRGTHAAEDGASFGPYILRFECLAESPQLRLTHSLIFDGDPEADQLCASELTLDAAVGDEQHFAFGGDEGRETRIPRQRAEFTPDFRYAELFQDSVSHWRLQRWVDLSNRAVFCDEGIHSDGWMELSGPGGRMAVAVREGWQNHPKSLFADAASGLMRIGLYARRAEPLNFRRYSEQVYNHTYECPSFKQLKDGQQRPYKPTPRNPEYNAYGIRKTHNILLMFDEPNPSQTTLFYNKPLRLTWPASYTRRTNIVAPAGTRLTKKARAITNGFLDLLGKEMLRSGGTGYIDYFDLPHGFDVETQLWFHDYGGFGYLNNEGMPTLGLWQAYLLTGRSDALAMGAAMARHNSDIDSFYLGTHAGTGARHNVTHWADQDREARVSQPLGTRFYYYITGDRSYMDIVPVMLDMWRRDFAEPKVMESHANFPSLLITLLTADEAGYADCDAWLRQCADALAAGIDERGVIKGACRVDATREQVELVGPNVISYLMFAMFGGAHTFAELAERYDHQPLRDALVRFARYQMLDQSKRVAVEAGKDWRGDTEFSRMKEPLAIQDNSHNRFRSLELFGYAYQLTGDERFRTALRCLRGKIPVTLETHSETRYGDPKGATRTVPVGVLLPGTNPKRVEAHAKLFPLFPAEERFQHLSMSLWMQKLQGAAVLGALDETSTKKK